MSNLIDDIYRLIIQSSSSYDRLCWLAVSKSWQAMILHTVKPIEELNYDEVKALYEVGDYLSLAILKPDISVYTRDERYACWVSSCMSEQWPIIKKLILACKEYIIEPYQCLHIYKMADQDVIDKVEAELSRTTIMSHDNTCNYTYMLLKLGCLCANKSIEYLSQYILDNNLSVPDWAIGDIVEHNRLDVVTYLLPPVDSNPSISVICHVAAQHGCLTIFLTYYVLLVVNNIRPTGLLVSALDGGNQTIINIIMYTKDQCDWNELMWSACGAGRIDLVKDLLKDYNGDIDHIWRVEYKPEILKILWPLLHQTIDYTDLWFDVARFVCYNNDINQLKCILELAEEKPTRSSFSYYYNVAKNRGYKKLIAFIDKNVVFKDDIPQNYHPAY